MTSTITLISQRDAGRLIEDYLGLNGTHWLADNAAGRHPFKIPIHKESGKAFYDPADVAFAIDFEARRRGRRPAATGPTQAVEAGRRSRSGATASGRLPGCRGAGEPARWCYREFRWVWC